MFGSDSCAAATVNGALAANAPTLPAASVARTRNRYDVAVPGTIERTMLVVSAAGSAIGVHVVPRSVDCWSSYDVTALPPALAVADQVNVTGTAVAVKVEWLTMLGTGAVADGPVTGAVPFTTSVPLAALAANVAWAP